MVSRLHPGDYNITDPATPVIEIADTTSLTVNSVLVVTQFSENNVVPSTGFRIFQDMNGNIEYLRLCKDTTTEVTADVVMTDNKIYVDDASVLPFVTPDSEYPGVVFIGGERITYWSVSLDDNYISDIRRATGGTGAVQRIRAGFLVVDGSKDQELPATDTHTNTWYNTGVGVAADGNGLQKSTTTNATFLKECEAQVPNYRLELNDKKFIVDDYVEIDYVEELP